jgi:transposase-like protein
MRSSEVFCPQMECPARGQRGEGNIWVHSRQPVRYKCTVCGKTFRERAGTIFFGRRTEEETITQVVTLVGHGCPIAAVEAAFGLQARTVRAWVAVAGAHCEALHQAEVLRPRALHQVQADEIRLKTQGAVLWVAMALMVSTRLWLGGVVSAKRDRALIDRLVALVVHAAALGPLLFVSDGLKSYVEAVRRAFRTPQGGTGGRPRLVVWPELVIAQVVKQYTRRRVSGTRHWLVHGTVRQYLTLLWRTPGSQVLNTAFIERLNATFRSRLAPFGRRTRCLARRTQTVERSLYLVGTLYNFCCVHASLTLNGQCRTPAMAAGITAHCWTVTELLWHRVPPPPWQPPRRRGRRSRALQALIDRWCHSTV